MQRGLFLLHVTMLLFAIFWKAFPRILWPGKYDVTELHDHTPPHPHISAPCSYLLGPLT